MTFTGHHCLPATFLHWVNQQSAKGCDPNTVN